MINIDSITTEEEMVQILWDMLNILDNVEYEELAKALYNKFYIIKTEE